MVMQKLRTCIELVRLAIDFLIVFAQAVDLVVDENSSEPSSVQSLVASESDSVSTSERESEMEREEDGAANDDLKTPRSKPLLFYKLMVASIVHDTKLKIPGKVVKRIDQELSIAVTLSVPDGRKWNVKLAKDAAGKNWFGDGWVEFMKYYSIRVGYLMVFRYKGDSTFVVNVFNLGNAEIQYKNLPDSVGCSENVKQEKQCSASKGNQSGNGDTQKLGSARVKEDKPGMLTMGKKSGKKLDSKQVDNDNLCSVTKREEPGNDVSEKKLGNKSSVKKVASVNDGSKEKSYLAPPGFVEKTLQSKLSELCAEIHSHSKSVKGRLVAVQLEKQHSSNINNNQCGNMGKAKSPCSEEIRQDNQCSVNLSKESANDVIVTQKNSGSKKVKQEKQCSASKGNQSVNDDTQKLGSARDKKYKPGMLTMGKEWEKKLDSKQVDNDKLCSATKREEPGNDVSDKKLGNKSSVKNVASVNDGTQKNSYLTPPGFVEKTPQSKLSELCAEIHSNSKRVKGPLVTVQLEKQLSFNNDHNQCGNMGKAKSSCSEETREDKQCSVNRSKEYANEQVREDKIRAVTKPKESANEVSRQKSESPPPGFTPKSSQQTPVISCGLSPWSKLSGSSPSGTEKEMKPSGADGARGSFLFVKDITPGLYRASLMSFKKTKQPRTRKANNPQSKNLRNDHLGLADRIKLNYPCKAKLTPETQISKVANSVATSPKSDGSVISQPETIADGVGIKSTEPEKLASETQPLKTSMNMPPVSQATGYSTFKVGMKDQLGTRLIEDEFWPKKEMTSANTISPGDGCTSVKRKEINIADLPNQITPKTFSVKQKVEVSTTDALNRTLENPATVHKKQKTVQLSAISNSRINPYCMVPLRTSYVRKKGILHIPANFASKYLKGAPGYATLQNPDEKQWSVRLLYTNAKTLLSQGWNQFVTDNNLKEGDICIFELLDSVNTLLKVSFIRSQKDPPPADPEVLKL